MKIGIIPALQDNYIYVLYCEESRQAVVVDPGDALPVSAYLTHKNLKLNKILLTHHHFDHIGGAAYLREKTGAQIFAPFYEKAKIAFADQWLEEGDKLFLFDGVEAEIWHMPGHTLGHITYYLPSKQLFFAGDVLFALGCGRLFEGTPHMMYSSLQRIKKLPQKTQIYAAHEYTLANASFALHIFPQNKTLQNYVERARMKRAKNEPTYPALLEDELDANPFLLAKSEEAFAQLRAAKDHF